MEYGLLGGRLGHSWSKPIHNMLADYQYELYAVTPEQLREIMLSRAFRGLNVTIPYKKDVIPYCDEISEEARQVGSVNTLVMGPDGRLRGYNTDLFGFLSMARRKGIHLAGKKVAILGTGGTSLTAQAACRREGARETVVVSRGGPVDYAALYREHADAEVIVNTTPVGMYPGNGEAPVQLDRFPRCQGVLDVIYNPLRTKLLLDAQARGIPCADGLWMLVAQAKKAAEYFIGRPIDDGEIRRVHAALRAQMANLVLIGMPGCGKSTVGQAAARIMGRDFVDLDTEIEREAGMSIPDIFAREGEAGFRARERAAAERFGREKSLVIATGGGVVKQETAMRALCQNGEALWLRRPVELLATDGRPLSRDRETVKKLEKERAPLYEQYGAARIDNVDGVEEAAQRVTEAFYEAVDR
ncbi:MAG: hypothetical protein IJ048_09870 [Clostridia bacterium]|nr:hypothetical protein [Clostridia bacterium]